MIFVTLTSAIFMALCAAIILYDLRDMRIPNAISLAFLALFVVWAVLSWPEVALAPRLLLAGAVFVITFALFALRIMGGGDTKVLSAMALFVPAEQLSTIALLLSLCLLVSIGVVVTLRATIPKERSDWSVITGRKLPMGLAIGATGLIARAAQIA